ncbi:hypothetical protein J40TS1_34430 [Paenibacillus montaniterrae]|uniref:Thoeris anti-defense 2-like domain-containing protein n=1 Tax=Paenibacillus montaniterrae TaxID=429341 RepID=A0A919YV24_9BACL|nr:hypothetical protein J40TS1_34430 [Paenibacillus montaniterrae]
MNIQEAARQAAEEKRFMTRRNSAELEYKKVKPQNGATRCLVYRLDGLDGVRAWLPSLNDLQADDWIVID